MSHSVSIIIIMDVWIVVKCVIYGFMVLFGLVLNSFILISSLIEKKLKTIPFLFSLNLTFINILLCIITMPSIVINTLLQFFKMYETFCFAIGYATMGLLATSVWSIALGSIHGFISINYALHYQTYVTRTRVYLSILCIWLLSFLIFIPPLVGWGNISQGDNLCLVDARKDISYLIFAMFFSFILPFTIILVSNLQMCIYLGINRKKMASMTYSEDSKIDTTCCGYIKEMLCCRTINLDDMEGILFYEI